MIRGLERTAGLKDLRFEAEPAGGSREMQSVVDVQGRIVGWFSWEPERSMAAALRQLQPLLALTGLCLIGFAGLALWQVRRAIRDLGHSEKRAWTLAHEDMLTRLPNHRKMIELIDAALAERAVEQTVTLAFIDLDGMNDINDALGQSAGDQFLAGFAQRLRDVLPEQCDRRPVRRRPVRRRDGHARHGVGRNRDRDHDVVARARVLDPWSRRCRLASRLVWRTRRCTA